MVLFVNVCLNQRVEVKDKGQIFQGSVKYKGPLVTKDGDWVGIALDLPVGMHGGLYKGRRYFSCKDGHGVFTRANRVRFIPLTRCLYNKYHTVNRQSFVDETLFSPRSKPEVKNGPYDPVAVSGSYTSRAGELFPDKMETFSAVPQSYRLSHTVGNHMAAATMRPRTAMGTLGYTSYPIHTEYAYEEEEPFISSPSIPKTHMPYGALKRQVKLGWENAHYVREMSVPTGRDSIKLSQWNDVSF